MDARELKELADLIADKLKEGGNDNMEHTYGRTNIDDFLTVRGFGGYGYGGYGGGGGGYGGGGYGGHGGILREDAHADGTARGENIKSNRDFVHYGHNVINDKLEDIQRSAQFHQIFEQNSNNAMSVERGFSSVIKQLCDNAAAAAECCCDTKTLILETKSDLVALNKDTVIAGLKSDNDNAANQSILNAINNMGQAIVNALSNLNNDKGHGRG